MSLVKCSPCVKRETDHKSLALSRPFRLCATGNRSDFAVIYIYPVEHMLSAHTANLNVWLKRLHPTDDSHRKSVCDANVHKQRW